MIKEHTDDRGFIDQLYNDDLPFKVKRIYRIRPLKDIIRGFHGHKEEQKVFIILKGIVKFVLVNMETNHTTTYVFREHDHLIIPNGYYNGFVALTDNVDMIGFSNFTLEESKKDDFREDPFKFGKELWECKLR